MSNHSDNDSQRDPQPEKAKLTPAQFEAIKPTEVPLSGNFQSDSAQQYSGHGTANGDKGLAALWRKHRLLMITLPLTLLILLAVIFILPSYITPPETASTSTAESATTPEPTKPPGPVESPWTDAQFAKQRRETQDLLAKLLDRQKSLESIHVNRWAEDTFQQASATAAEADVLYREQEFQQAKALYQQVLEQFDQLLAQSEDIFSNSVDSGLAAISAGDSSTAREHFELATLIHPESTEAQTGLERAQVLDDVLALLREGSRYQRQGELDQAKQLFTEALQTDRESAAAQSKIEEINAAIKERDYAKAMSQGFAAVNRNQYHQAITHFQQALSIKPGAEDAKAAITQARNQSTQQSLQQYIDNAVAAEKNEQWQVAVDNYEQALKLDGNLVQAKVGKIKAEHRAAIDQRLTDILENPERLTSEAVFKEYQALGREVRDMQRGPRLQQQFEQLEQAMRRAIAPVDIVLQSDNQTEVTIYQVGELGKFDQRELTLKPGKYTVVGTRSGYRDVRQEITISANTTNNPVVVQCVEPINNG